MARRDIWVKLCCFLRLIHISKVAKKKKNQKIKKPKNRKMNNEICEARKQETIKRCVGSPNGIILMFCVIRFITSKSGRRLIEGWL